MAEYPVAYPISVGRLRAGDWASSVPDLLVARDGWGCGSRKTPQRPVSSWRRLSPKRAQPTPS
jgi:acetylornithine deacetylase